jgi:MFS family permease
MSGSTGATRRGPAQRLGPFRHRVYAAYWLGISVSNLGSWLQTVAGSIFVYQLTGSSFAVGIFNFAGFIPILLFSTIGGQLSDRFDRRDLVQATHLLSLLIAGALAFLTVTGLVTEVTLIGAVFLVNVLWALGKPALVSVVPNIVPREDLQDAVALTSLSFVAGQIAGPAIAALVMATAGPGLAFGINALTYLGPVLAVVLIGRAGMAGRVVERPGAAERDRENRSAAGYIRGHRWVAGVLVGVVVTAAGMDALRTLAPAVVAERLGLEASTAGLLLAVGSLGSALPLLFFVQIRRRGWAEVAAVGGYALEGLGFAAIWLAPDVAIAMLGAGMIGAGFSLSFPTLTAALQAAIPDHLRGRVMAVHQMAHLGSRPLTGLAVGSVAGLMGTGAGILSWLVIGPIGLLATRAAWGSLRAASASSATGSGPADPIRVAAAAAAGEAGDPAAG